MARCVCWPDRAVQITELMMNWIRRTVYPVAVYCVRFSAP